MWDVLYANIPVGCCVAGPFVCGCLMSQTFRLRSFPVLSVPFVAGPFISRTFRGRTFCRQTFRGRAFRGHFVGVPFYRLTSVFLSATLSVSCLSICRLPAARLSVSCVTFGMQTCPSVCRHGLFEAPLSLLLLSVSCLSEPFLSLYNLSCLSGLSLFPACPSFTNLVVCLPDLPCLSNVTRFS